LLRIGCVKYLNARPLIHGWPGEVILDHPAALCRKLAGGELDVALVSSYEYLRNPIYKIVDGISISSDGPVYSVVVASAGEQLTTEIELDPASETSVALFQALMRRRGQPFHEVATSDDVLAPLGPDRSRLLIGDQALRFRQKFGTACRYLDLGQEWKGQIGWPFVYALWLVRPEFVEARQLGDDLRALRDHNLRNLRAIIKQEQNFDPEFCRHYYTANLRFSFGNREKQGLEKFATACAELNLIETDELKLNLI
jgi:chorismate dehydratase